MRHCLLPPLMFVVITVSASAQTDASSPEVDRMGRLINARQYAEAVRLGEAYLKTHPDDGEAVSLMAQAYMSLNRTAEASQMFRRAAALYEARAATLQAQPTPGRTAAAPAAPTAPAPARYAPALAATVPAQPATLTAGGPQGLYLMTRYWSGQGLEIVAYWFQGGVVVRNPIGGGQAFNPAAERATHPGDIGNYSLVGGQLSINFPNSKGASRLEPDKGGCFNWDLGIFCPAEPFPPRTMLSGTYSGGSSANNGAAIASSDVTFRPDGTYVRESVASFSSKSDRSTMTTGTSGGERGTYRLDGTALTFMPAGGQPRTVCAFPYDDGTKGPQPRRLFLGGVMMKHL